MEDKEFGALFEGATYSMGWYEDEDGQRRFRIDVGDAPQSQWAIGAIRNKNLKGSSGRDSETSAVTGEMELPEIAEYKNEN